MANVKINIPGIGEVTAENAASEETLMRLVEAIEKQTTALSKNSGGDSKASKNPKEIKETKDLIDAKKKETKAVDDTTKSTKTANKGTEDYTKAQKKSTEALNSLKNAWDGMKPGLGQAGGALIDFGASVGKTALSVASAFAATYDNMSKDPIGEGAKLLNTGIDLMSSASKAAADVATGLVKSAGGLLGPFSGAVTGAADGANALAKQLIDAAVAVAKAANDIMANEFKKSAGALKSYTAQGASFAGGMTEMRLTAKSAGLTIDALAATAKLASSDLREMGLNQADGVRKLAKGMDAASKTIGKSGGSLRDEMLGLGYSYEEQGAVMASYMAQQKASGALEKMNDEQIAKGTAEYAKNLKVISDITGQDAKKLMDKARAESMRGALMSKLDAKQQESFKLAHSAMAGMGPEFQNALMQMLAGGTVTDPMIAGNQEAMAMIKKVASGVSAGNKDMLNETNRAMSEAAAASKEQQKRTGGALDSAVMMSNNATSAITQGLNAVGNKMSAYQPGADAAERSADSANKQAEATDSLTKSYQQITKDANAAAMVMEDLATANLGLYAKTLSKTYQEATGLFVKGVTAMQQLLDGTLLSSIPKTKEDQKVADATAKKAEATKESEKAFKDASIGQKLGITSTKEQDAAAKKTYLAQNDLYNAQIEKARAEAQAEREKGKANGEFFAKLSSFFHGEGYANGGIATGPKTGYPALLHGTEAVIPLEGGKKVPIDISSVTGALEGATTVSGVVKDKSKVASMMPPGRLTMPGTTDLSSSVKNLDAAITSTLGEQFNKISTLFIKDKEEAKQQKPPAAKSSDNNEQLLKEIKELMSSQLAKHDEMIDKLGETVDINQRLLTNSYS